MGLVNEKLALRKFSTIKRLLITDDRPLVESGARSICTANVTDRQARPADPVELEISTTKSSHEPIAEGTEMWTIGRMGLAGA